MNMYQAAVKFADANQDATETDILDHLRELFPYTAHVKRKEAAGEPRRRRHLTKAGAYRAVIRSLRPSRKGQWGRRLLRNGDHATKGKRK